VQGAVYVHPVDEAGVVWHCHATLVALAMHYPCVAVQEKHLAFLVQELFPVSAAKVLHLVYANPVSVAQVLHPVCPHPAYVKHLARVVCCRHLYPQSGALQEQGFVRSLFVGPTRLLLRADVQTLLAAVRSVKQHVVAGKHYVLPSSCNHSSSNNDRGTHIRIGNKCNKALAPTDNTSRDNIHNTMATPRLHNQDTTGKKHMASTRHSRSQIVVQNLSSNHRRLSSFYQALAR
jgi:hypothetical protein